MPTHGSFNCFVQVNEENLTEYEDLESADRIGERNEVLHRLIAAQEGQARALCLSLCFCKTNNLTPSKPSLFSYRGLAIQIIRPWWR